MFGLFSTAPARAEDIDGSYAWSRLWLSLLLGTLGSVGSWAVVVILPDVQQEFGVDRAGASLPYTLAMVGFGLGNGFIGRALDRFGIVGPLAIAAAALGCGLIAASFSPNIVTFTALHFLIGLGTAATFGPLITDISHWFVRNRGIAVGLVASGNYLGGAVWPNVVQALLRAGDWRFAYLVIGAALLVTMVPLALLLRRPSPKVAPAGLGVQSAVRRETPQTGLSPTSLQVLLMIAGIGCCVAMSMPQVHIVAYCADLGYGPVRGSEMLSLMLAAGIVSRIGSGFLADRIGGVRTLLIGSVLQGLSLLLYIPFDGLVSLYVVSFVFGLSQGGIVPSYAIIVREYLPPQEAGKRVGFVIMATVAGMALGGWMSGWIYDQTGSYAAAFLNGIAWNVLNVSVMAFILLRTRTPRQRGAPAVA